MDIYLGRQPILDGKQNTVAYELLYRSSGEINKYTGTDAVLATSRVLYNVFCSMDIGEVTGGRQAFVNFSRELLIEGMPRSLRPGQLVIEVLEDTVIDEPVIRACRQLVDRGFTLALDDFVLKRETEPLLPLASIIKIDWKAYSRGQIDRLTKALTRHKKDLLAEKIETIDEYRIALDLGFKYFQGFFFAKPVILKAKDVPMSYWMWLEILQAIHSPELDVNETTELFSREPSLSYKLLKIVNSAAFTHGRTISSIRQAIVLLGEEELRRWLSILVLARMSNDKPREVIATACIRGRFGENLAKLKNHARVRSSTVFLMGILSLLDTMTGRPLTSILSGLPLDPDIPKALLGNDGPLAGYLDLVLSYERMDEPAILRCLESLGLGIQDVSQCYIDAVKWTETSPLS
jgi:c-di-GMP-related signal transduction protein